MVGWFNVENPGHQRAKVELRLIVLSQLRPPPGWEGNIAELRRAVIADQKINHWTERLVAACDAGRLTDRRLRNFVIRKKERTDEIAWSILSVEKGSGTHDNSSC